MSLSSFTSATITSSNGPKSLLARQTSDMDVSELSKDSEFWFHDGNVVLVAQRGAFRVHRSILSRHSEVFRNMFAIPVPSTPDSSTEQLEGLPAIPVSDSAHDFKHLLHALYDGSKWVLHGSIAIRVRDD